MVVPLLSQGTFGYFRIKVHLIGVLGRYNSGKLKSCGEEGGGKKTEDFIFLGKHADRHDGKARKDNPCIRLREHFEFASP